jgi:hypothetical protein
MTAALPVSVTPRPGESIESWLEHLADANGLTTAQLLTATGRGRAGTRYLTLAPSPETITRLAALARVDEQDVYAATLAAFDGTALDLTGLDPADRHSYRQVAARGWAPAHGTQICPACLAEDGAWQSAWRLLIVTTCTRHESLLVARCPSCRRPFRDQRHSHLRRVGAATVCGNPLGAGPTRQCQHDLTTIEATSASDDVLAVQARVDAALAGQQVTVLGQAAKPAAYLTDLRHLTTLLLHLAGQPGAAQLAPWVTDLAEETEARSGDRGPRWGLRPPEHPGLRAAALATADGILTAPDVDDGCCPADAVDRAHPDHQRRPARVARRPHRHDPHPDPPGHGRPRPAPAPVPPPRQPPGRAYADQPHPRPAGHPARPVPRAPRRRLHLQRGHRPAVRVPVPGAAAPGRDVVGRGRRSPEHARPDGCALRPRLLSHHARQRGRVEEPDLAGREETERRDYRATEAKIHHRLGMTRWFNEWARRNRPDARYGDHDLALTWQWVHVAHAHLDLSPVWRGKKPTAKDRAHYRQFADSLDERQQFELAYALHKRA